jgi:phosphatidylserine decarboxylase
MLAVSSECLLCRITQEKFCQANIDDIRIHDKFQRHGNEVKKGEEIGIFQFGASSIIVAFEPERIQFDKDLVELSKRRIQVSVEVGMRLGQSTIQ